MGLGRKGIENLNGVLAGLEPAEAKALWDAVSKSAYDNGVWFEYSGSKKAIPLTLRPRLLDLSRRGYVHHVTWQIRLGLRRVIQLVISHPRAAEVVPLEPEERAWFERYVREPQRKRLTKPPRVFCRLDALVRFHGPKWKDTLKFVETNVVGIGGMSYAPGVEKAVFKHVVPKFKFLDDELDFDTNWDPRLLLLDELNEHVAQLGVEGPPTIGFVDDKSLYRHGGEFGRLVPFFQAKGIKAIYADPRELELSTNGEVFAFGEKLDVIYRFLLLQEFIEMEKKGSQLSAMRRAFELGMVVPTAGGDLEHKSIFEILTDPSFRSAFDEDQLEVFDKHVLWTRLIYNRKTTDPVGNEIELNQYLLKNRRSLVLKPNRGYGGEGVLIGDACEESLWNETVSSAFSNPKSYVVQWVSPPNIEPFPVIDSSGCVDLVPHFTTTGFFPGRQGLGIFGRFSKHRVVNINTGGGIVPYLVHVK